MPKLNVTDGQTDGGVTISPVPGLRRRRERTGHCNISRPGPTAGDKQFIGHHSIPRLNNSNNV